MKIIELTGLKIFKQNLLLPSADSGATKFGSALFDGCSN